MPGTFTHDLILVENAEVVTDYSLIGALKTARALNDDFKIEGTNAITFGVSSGTGVGTSTIVANLAAAVDFSASSAHFFQWIKILAWPSLANHANGGVRISISSDAPPTAILSVLKATVTAGGTGYTVNDELTLTGGTTTQAAILTVTTVSGGVVTAVSPKAITRGMYTILPANPISTTGGTGTGATLNIAGTGNPPDGWVYGTTNNKDWFVGGPDTVIVDGWVNYAVDINGTPDLQSGTPIISSIDRMGLTVTAIAATKGAAEAMDISNYGTGITVKDGTVGAPVTFEDIRIFDNANVRALGIIVSQAGIFFLGGKLSIGTVTQTAVTVLKDKSQVLVYQGFPVSTSFYEMIVAGASGFVTTFQLGLFSAGVASGGVTIRGAGRYTHYAGVSTGLVPAVWTLTASNAFATALLYGCTLSQMRRAFLNSTAELRSCTFDTFGEIEANSALIQNCVFQNVRTTSPVNGTWALIIDAPAELTNVKNNNFISCNKAIKITAAGTYTFDNLTFSGNTFDVENSSAGLVTINVINGGTTPVVTNTGGGSSVVNNSVTLTVTVKDEAGVAISAAQVGIFKDSDGTQLMNEATIGDGTATETFNFVSNTNVSVRVRKGTGGGTKYVPVSSPQTITTAGLAVTITLSLDATNTS